MSKREKLKEIRQAQKLAIEPKKLNPNYKPGRRTMSEIFAGVNRSKYLKNDY